MMFGQVYSQVRRLRSCKTYWQDKIFEFNKIQILLKYWTLGVLNTYVNIFFIYYGSNNIFIDY